MENADLPPRGLTTLGLFTTLLRRWRLLMDVCFWGAAATAAWMLVAPHSYTSSASFMAQAGRPLSAGLGDLAGLAGLAGQAGLLGGSTGGGSPDLYQALLTNRVLLESTLLTRFPDPTSDDGASAALIDILEVEGDSPNERLYHGTVLLEGKVKTALNRRTGLVTLSVTMPNPQLAAEVANTLVALVNRFSIDQLQTQSRAQRAFVAQRLGQAEQELHAAEAEQLSFLQSNRTYLESPILTFEASRLERRVAIKQDVFMTLTREFEQARITEVQDTPLLTIVEPASFPFFRSAPARRTTVLLVTVLLFVATATGIIVSEFRTVLMASTSGDYQTFTAAWRAALSDFVQSFLRGRRRGTQR